MENLDKYIHDNLAAFDEEPTNDHYQRFQNKQQKTQRRKTVFLTTQIAIAASLLLFITIGLFPTHEQVDKITIVCEESDDMKACYLSQMYDIASHLETITEGMDVWNRQIVDNEVNSIINSIDDIEFYIPEELPTEDRKQILAGYYRQNIETLQNIVELVAENNSSKK